MRRKDLTPVFLVIVISAIFAAIVSNALFGGSKTHNQEVERITDISAEFTQPDSAYFNESSINPTQIIRIGGGDGNTSPFSEE